MNEHFKISSFLFLLILYFSSFCQKKNDFEGVIKYKIEYFDKAGKIITNKRQRPLGDTSIAFIKKGNYAQFYPHSRVKSVIYLSKENKYYSIFNGYDTILVQNYLTPSSAILNFGKKDTSITVLDYICKGYKIETETSTLMFFYTESLYLNPKYFKNHKESGYNHYSEDTKSVYLKLVITYQDYSVVFTAVEIDTGKVSDQTFKIPNRPLKNK